MDTVRYVYTGDGDQIFNVDDYELDRYKNDITFDVTNRVQIDTFECIHLCKL